MADGDEDAVLPASLANLDLGGEEQRQVARPSRDPLAVRAVRPSRLKARDITSEFLRASSRLGVGELVKDEGFSLFDAVGALEIMDPKMDNGFLAPGESLDDEYDVSQPLSPEQVLGVMDAMLAAEVAWQMGHSFNVTLFTSIYVDHLLWPAPARLEDANFTNSTSTGSEMVHVVLRSYCLAMIKSCDMIHRMVCAETYYEEEDFVSSLFNRTLLSNISGDDICVLVEHALTTVDAFNDPVGSDIQAALRSRLRYRMAFLRAVMAEPRMETTGTSDYWKVCLECLEEIENTHPLASPMAESFSVKLQRKLDSTIPPRPIIQLEFDAATKFLQQLCTNAIDAVEVLKCSRVSGIITFLQVFFSQKPQPAVYIRCLVQAMIFAAIRGPQIEKRRDFFFEDLEELVLPAHVLTNRSNANAEHPDDNRFKMWSTMSRFVEQVCEPFFDILRALCMNRARARRMLCNLLNEWDGLQLDLEDVDNDLRPITGERSIYQDVWELPLSSWGYYYKLCMMQWIIQIGFELQMYHSDEWPGLYRYLQDVAEHRHKHIERIYGFVHHRATSVRGSAVERKALDHCVAFLVAAAEEAMATSSLAESFACLYEALAMLRLLPTPPPRPYGTASLRHALRLRPFLPLCLPTMSSPSEPFAKSDDYTASIPLPKTHSHLPKDHRRALALLDVADTTGRKARKAWDGLLKLEPSVMGCEGCEDRWRQSIKGVLRAAITSGVAGARVRKWVLAGAPKDELTVTLDLGTKDHEMPGGMAASWKVPQTS